MLGLIGMMTTAWRGEAQDEGQKQVCRLPAGRGRDWEWADADCANAFVLPWQLNVSDRGDGVRCPGMGMAPGDLCFFPLSKR